MEYHSRILCLCFIISFLRRGHSIKQAGRLVYKYRDRDPEATTSVGTTNYMIMEVDKNANGYLMKKGATYEHHVPIVEGDPDYAVWNVTATTAGGSTVQQFSSTLRKNLGYMENYLIAADKNGNTANYFEIDTFLADANTPVTGSRFKVLSCPNTALELGETPVEVTVKFGVDTSVISETGYLMFAHFQSVRDRYWGPFQENTPIDMKLYHDDEDTIWTFWNHMPGKLNYTIHLQGKRTSVTVPLILDKVGLYSITHSQFGKELGVMPGGEGVMCNIQVTEKGQLSWYDKRTPEIDIGGELELGRRWRGETAQVNSWGGYLRCSAAGNPLPEVELVYYGQCNPSSTVEACPTPQVITGPHLTTYLVRPDVLETVYFFANHGTSGGAQGALEDRIGWYTCRATNAHGTVAEDFELLE